MDILHRREKVGKLRQFVIMRGEKRTRVDVLLEMLDHRPSNGQTIEGSRAAADFIEKNKAGGCGVVENGRDFAHFHEERGAATREIIACADAREDAVGDGQLRLTRGDERADLGHQHNERRLAKIGRLAAHVRTGDEKKLLTTGLKAKVVGNKALAFLPEKFLNHGMAASNDQKLTGGAEFRPGVSAIGSQLCERRQHIELRHGGSCAPQSRRLGGYRRTHVDKKLPLNLEHALIRGKDLPLIFS